MTTTDSFASTSPVFLLGIARSGTTLLQSLLDGHPQLLVDVADSHFYRWYRHYYRLDGTWRRWTDNLAKRIALAEDVMISHIFNPPSHYYQTFLSFISIPELKTTFRQLVTASKARPKDFMEAYFHSLGLASRTLTERTQFWVDKTLSYEYLYFRYYQWWPNARFIIVARDPRDIYSSYKSRDIKNNRPLTSIVSFAHTWGQFMDTCKKLQRLVPASQFYLLKYEDLTADANTTMTRVVEFLGVEKTPELMRPTKGFGRVAWGGNAESGHKEFGVFQDAAHKWKKKLTPAEVRQIESLLHRQMQYAGYELSSPLHPDPLLNFKFFIRKTAFQIANTGL